MTLTFGGLFSGLGGIELGMQRAGMNVRWHAELDAHCSSVLAHWWPDVPNLGDVQSISHPERVDVLGGGFPCQGVSSAQVLRKGLHDERSRLFYEAARIIDEVRPTWVVIENVRGLLTSGHGPDGRRLRGADFYLVAETLAERGYEDLAYRVVDSRAFGIPQRRERLYLVGRLGGGTAAKEVLLDTVPGTRSPGEGLAAAWSPAPRAGTGVAVGVRSYRKSRRAQSTQVPETWVEDDYANTLTRFGVGGGVTPTTLITDPTGVRRLTPVETERLQGFPDGWTQPIGTDTPRVQRLGNAVTVDVAHWVGARIAAYEEREAA